jgi:hypothetical protein
MNTIIMSPNRTPGREQGAATLLIAMILLFTITLISILTARTTILETKIAANEFRGKQAFEAADAGVQYAISYLNANGTTRSAGSPLILSATLGNSSSYNCTLFDASSTAAEVLGTNCSAPIPENHVCISSTGSSDDTEFTRTISQLLLVASPLSNPPNNPLTSKSIVDIRGSGTIINPEGNSTIWSGHNMAFTGANPRTFVASPDPAATLDGSPNEENDLQALVNELDAAGMDSSLIGAIAASSTNDDLAFDVVADDANLAALTGDEFFENFFGYDPATYNSTMVTTEIEGGMVAGALSGLTNEIIRVDGDAKFTSNITIGTVDNPVVLIIDGDLVGAGTVTVNGILYVRGDWTGAGTLDIRGGAIVEGNVEGIGNMNVIYSSMVLDQVGKNLSKTGPISGTWRDF